MEDARGGIWIMCYEYGVRGHKGVLRVFVIHTGFRLGLFLVLCESVNTMGLPFSQCVSLREQMQLCVCVCVCGKLANVNASWPGSERRLSCSRPRAHSAPVPESTTRIPDIMRAPRPTPLSIFGPQAPHPTRGTALRDRDIGRPPTGFLT